MKKRKKKNKFKIGIKEIKYLLKINAYVFPFLVSLTYFFLLLETYTYIGFLRKFFLVDSRFFMVATLVSVFGLVFSRDTFKLGGKARFLIDIVFYVNLLVTPVFFVSFFIIRVLEANNYPNYIFSKFHLQPDNFSLVFLLAIFISAAFLIREYLLQDLRKKHLYLERRLKKRKILLNLANNPFWIFWLLMTVYCLVGVIITPTNFVLGFILLFIILFVSLWGKFPGRHDKGIYCFTPLLKINNLMMIISGCLYFIFLFLELRNYTNYVLSSFGIFFTPFIYLLLFYLIFPWLLKDNFSVFDKNKNNKYGMIILGLLVVVVFVFVGDFTWTVAREVDLIIENRQSSYDEKMAARITDFYWLAKFVKDNTPESAVIYLPYQRAPWQRGGNPYYIRYFLYPRKLVGGYYHLDEYNGSAITHYISSFGDSKSYSKALRKQWPEFKIDADKIIFDNGEILYNTTYDPDDPVFTNYWAVIKARRQ